MAIKNVENQRCELPVGKRMGGEQQSSCDSIQIAFSELVGILFVWMKGVLGGRRKRERKDSLSIGFTRPKAETATVHDLEIKMDSRLGVARYNKSISNANATHRR